MSLASLKASLSSTESLLSTAKTNAKSSFKTMVLADQSLQNNYSSFTSTDYTTYTTYKTTNIQDNKIIAELLRDEQSTLDLINATIQSPGIPTDVKITNTTTTSLTVTFTNESGITSNTITAVPSVPGSTVTATFSSGSPYTLTGLSASTTYTVTISASNSSESSSASSSVTATTQSSSISSITSSTSYSTTGSAVLSTAQSYSGSSSLYLPSSSGNYVVVSSVPCATLGGNWTVEFSVYVPAGFTGPGVPLSMGDSSGTFVYTEWSSGQCTFYLATQTANTWNIMNGVSAAYVTGWNHVAICSDYVQITHAAYLNGVQVTSVQTPSWRIGTRLTQWNFGSYLNGGVQSGAGSGLYVDNLHVSDTVRYSGSTYTVPTYTLVDSYTVFTNTFEGSNGETLNSSSESFYRTFAYNTYGGAVVSTGASKFGSASLYFSNATSAAGGYLQVVGLDNSTLTGSWTVEMWFYPTTTASATPTNNHQGLFTTGIQGPSAGLVGIAMSGGTATMSYWAGTFSGHTSSTPTLNDWNHAALVCSGGTNYYCFLNGSLLSSGTGNNMGQYLATFNIGILNHYKAVMNNGYIDEVRVSSTARYTTNFTPSSSAFSSDSDTVFLNHFDS
jgi:hypothetical protein